MTLSFGGSFEREYDAVDIRWWKWTDDGQEFLLARIGCEQFEKWMTEFDRTIGQVRGKKRKLEDVDERTSERITEGLWRFIVLGVRGAVASDGSPIVFDPLDDEASTLSELEFRDLVKRTLNDNKQFRIDVLRCSQDFDSYLRENLNDAGKDYAARFAGLQN